MRSSSRGATALLIGAGVLMWTQSSCFIAGAPRETRVSAPQRSPLSAWPWEVAALSAEFEQVYAKWGTSYPTAVATGEYFGGSADKITIEQRFQGLVKLLGAEIALEAALKEPIILLFDTLAMQGSFDAIMAIGADAQRDVVLEIVRKNPKVLTVAKWEFERTKPSIEGLKSSASAIDFLRPLGEWGLFAAIFGGFTAFLIVIRPVIYGTNGAPSLLSYVIDPIMSVLPPVPNLNEAFQGLTGLNLSVLIALFPVYVVSKAIKEKFLPEKQSEVSL